MDSLHNLPKIKTENLIFNDKKYLDHLIDKYFLSKDKYFKDLLKEWLLEVSIELWSKFWLNFSKIDETSNNIFYTYDRHINLEKEGINFPNVPEKIEIRIIKTSSIILDLFRQIMKDKITLFFFDRDKNCDMPVNFSKITIMELTEDSSISIYFKVSSPKNIDDY